MCELHTSSLHIWNPLQRPVTVLHRLLLRAAELFWEQSRDLVTCSRPVTHLVGILADFQVDGDTQDEATAQLRGEERWRFDYSVNRI